MDHLRYPEDLFKVQRYQFARYHVTDPATSTRERPLGGAGGPGRGQPPAAAVPPVRRPAGRRPAASRSTFSLTSVFVPYRKSNLAAFVSVDSDATSPTYGQMRGQRCRTRPTPGPGQIANEFASNNDVRDALLQVPVRRRLAAVRQPADDPGRRRPDLRGAVYAVRAPTSGYPILQYVLVSYGGEVGIARPCTARSRTCCGRRHPARDGERRQRQRRQGRGQRRQPLRPGPGQAAGGRGRVHGRGRAPPGRRHHHLGRQDRRGSRARRRRGVRPRQPAAGEGRAGPRRGRRPGPSVIPGVERVDPPICPAPAHHVRLLSPTRGGAAR